MSKRTCKNCGTELQGEYCHNCGQKWIDDRLTFRKLCVDAFDSITNIETGFLKTTFGFLRRPSEVFHHYITGVTKPYMKPFRFALIWATISVLIMAYFGIFDKQMELMEAQMNVRERSAETKAFQQKIYQMIGKYMSLVILAGIPFSALASRMAFFNKKYEVNGQLIRYSYSEHLILSTFILGVATALGTVFNLASAAFSPLIAYGTAIGFALNYFMYLWSFKRIFKDNWFLAPLKAGLVSFLSLLLIVLVSMSFAAVYAVYHHMTH